MTFQMSFGIFALIAYVLYATSNAVARPLARTPRLITLPLRPVRQSRTDLHPQILLQQHINHGARRLALMSGRTAPTDEELLVSMANRIALLPHGPATKRYNVKGINSSALKSLSLGGLSLHSTDSDDDVTSANNSLPLHIISQDVGYFATVQIGTPPQDFQILMDSGSADLWVGSEECESLAGGGCGNHLFLGEGSSSSFTNLGTPFNITYGTGTVAGTKVTDDVTIAGLTLSGHKFGVAARESTDFSDNSTPFDGLMGLALSTLSNQRTLTPVEALASKGLIQDAITSYKISRRADDPNGGEITFGGLDASKFDASTLVTLDNQSGVGFYEAALDGVTVGGADAGLAGRTAILDTGTTVVVAPPADAAAVHALIPGAQPDGQGGFTVPCNTNASVALVFGGHAFAIDSRDLAFAPVDPQDPDGDCASGISSGNIGGATEWLVGDVFLKNAYYSTDAGKNQISLAELV